MGERIVVQQTWHYGGTESRYRLRIMPQGYTIMTGPYAGPYATHAQARRVAAALNAQIAAAARQGEGEGTTMPRHGAERNRRTERTDGPMQSYRQAETGQLVYTGPAWSRTETVSDKWCATCQDWREVRGIAGVLLGCSGCGAEW